MNHTYIPVPMPPQCTPPYVWHALGATHASPSGAMQQRRASPDVPVGEVGWILGTCLEGTLVILE